MYCQLLNNGLQQEIMEPIVVLIQVAVYSDARLIASRGNYLPCIPVVWRTTGTGPVSDSTEIISCMLLQSEDTSGLLSHLRGLMSHA